MLVDDGTGIVGFGDWAEQLIAESTGKDGTGILPVVVDRHRAGRTSTTTAPSCASSPPTPTTTPRPGRRPPRHPGVTVAGPLGAQFLLWEAATAVAGRLLGINPFDQPDVESAKTAARELLDAGIGAGADPAFTDGAVEVRALGGDWLGGADHRRRRGRRAARRSSTPSTATSP